MRTRVLIMAFSMQTNEIRPQISRFDDRHTVESSTEKLACFCKSLSLAAVPCRWTQGNKLAAHVALKDNAITCALRS